MGTTQGEKTMPDSLEKEFEWYLKNQADLVKKYDGKYIVVKDGKVIGEYKDLGPAIDETVAKGYEMGTFLVQKCSPGDQDTTAVFHSRVG